MGKSLRNTLLILAFCIAVPTIAFLYFARQRENARLKFCQGNLRQIAIGLKQYQGDYDGKYPPATIGGLTAPSYSSYPYTSGGPPVGWADALLPYLKGVGLYQCASDSNPKLWKPNRSGYIAFWFNSNLSGVGEAALLYPETTLLLGEGSDGIDVTDATYSKSRFPATWLNDPTKPPWRHFGGAHYAFNDGHTAWLKPNEVTTNFGRANCFAIK